MTVSRRSLLKFISLAPALGIAGKELERLYDTAAKAPDLPEAAAPRAGRSEPSLGVVIDGASPLAMRSMEPVANFAPSIEVTTADDKERRYFPGYRQRQFFLRLPGAHDVEPGEHSLEIRLEAATLTFRAVVDSVMIFGLSETGAAETVLCVSLEPEQKVDWVLAS